MAIDQQQWIGDIKATEQTGLYAIEVKITGQNQSGKQVSFYKDDISVLGMKIIQQEESLVEGNSAADEQPVDEPSESPQEEQSSSLLMSFIVIAGINLVLLVMGGGVYFYLRRKRQQDEFDLMDDIAEGGSDD